MRPCCQCCGNGCNNSQHSWPITGVGLSRGFIALLSPRRPFSVMHVHGPNNVDGRAMQTDQGLVFISLCSIYEKTKTSDHAEINEV